MKSLARLRVLIVLVVLLAGSVAGAQGVAAGTAPAAPDAALAQEGFPLTAFTAYCEPGYMGPFQGCTPWEGVTVSFVSADPSFSTTCVTAAGVNAASCSVTVPFGSTITASIDPSAIGAGFSLEGSLTQVYEIPDGPPEGEFGGPAFVLFENVEQPAETVALPVYASLCADGYAPHDDCSPWEGALATVTLADGTWIGECVTATIIEYAAGCEVMVERGTSVLVTISMDTLPEEYMLWTVQQSVDVPVEGEPEGPMFLAVPVGEEDSFTTLPVFASICDDALAPNDDCSPWEGVVITAVTNDDAEYADACVTETFFETVAGCEIPMPRGSNVTAYISEDQIPEGYELFVEVPTWDMPEEGELESGPYFFLVPVDDEKPTPTPATPVKRLPSTGSGLETDDNATLAFMAGTGVLLMAGAGFVYANRER